MPLFDGHHIEIHYRWRQRGSADKQPVILLHGLGSSGQDWFPQFQALPSAWPVLTLDFPGHGDSPPLEEPISVHQLAQSVGQLMMDESNKPFHLIGLSLGAVVGLQVAVDQPAGLQSAMLVNGFARYRAGTSERLGAILRLLFLLSGRMDWVGWWVARSVFPEQEHEQFRRLAAERIASVDRGSYWHYLKALGNFDLRSSLSEVGLASLIVAGAEDQIVPRSAKLELAEGIPDANYVEFENSGHGTPIDAHERFNELMLDWLESNEAE